MTRHQPGCCCGAPGCPGGPFFLTVTVTICAGAIVLPGALVELLSGGSTVASCTTGAGGSCSIPIPAAGSYQVRVSRANYATQTRNVNLTCANSGQSFQLVAAAGYTTLAGCAEPFAGNPTAFQFSLTDHLGTVTLTYTGGSYVYGACRSFATHWGRAADAFGNCTGSYIPVTSAVYYELGLTCTGISLAMYYPTCSFGSTYCSFATVAAACQASRPFAIYNQTVAFVASKSCPTAFAISGQWGADSLISGGVTLAYGCNLGQLYDKPGGNPYYIPGSDDIPSGYTDFTLSQL